MWHIGDFVLQQAYAVLCAEPYCLPYLGTFQFLETTTSDIMQFNHVVAAVLDFLNSNKYIPKTVAIHTGHSDFGVMPQHFVKFYMAQMANTIRDLICQAQPYRHHHISIFVSLMLPETWYAGWNMQKVARKARAYFNGCLACAATMAGQYVVSHPELGLQDQPAFIEPGTTRLSRTSNLIFMADIQSLVRKVDPEFKPPATQQVPIRIANEAKMQHTPSVTHKVAIYQ